MKSFGSQIIKLERQQGGNVKGIEKAHISSVGKEGQTVSINTNDVSY